MTVKSSINYVEYLTILNAVWLIKFSPCHSIVLLKTVSINCLMFSHPCDFVNSCRTPESGRHLWLRTTVLDAHAKGRWWFNVLIYTACKNQCCCRLYNKTKLQVRNVTAMRLKQTTCATSLCVLLSRAIHKPVCSTENAVSFYRFFCCFTKTTDDKEKAKDRNTVYK